MRCCARERRDAVERLRVVEVPTALCLPPRYLNLIAGGW